LHTKVQHLINVDDNNSKATEEIAAFKSIEVDPYSITQFLQLPTVIARVNSSHGDPIIDYMKSIILSSSEYVEAVAHILRSKENATREKAAQRKLQEEMRRIKAADHEAEAARRAAER
jgi:hypothetical protein